MRLRLRCAPPRRRRSSAARSASARQTRHASLREGDRAASGPPLPEATVRMEMTDATRENRCGPHPQRLPRCLSNNDGERTSEATRCPLTPTTHGSKPIDQKTDPTASSSIVTTLGSASRFLIKAVSAVIVKAGTRLKRLTGTDGTTPARCKASSCAALRPAV